MTGKQIAGLGAVLLATGVVGARYLEGARASLDSGRASACRALNPEGEGSKMRSATVGHAAPDFEAKDASGKTWKLSQLRGKPVLLNFWATWCPPCVEEMPSMEELARRLGDRATVLAVSVDEGWDVVHKFFGARGTPLSLLLDETKEVPKKYGTEKYPETFLIDAEGRVRHHFVNTRKWDKAEAIFCVESVR